MVNKEYFVGLDIGTDSVGIAATDCAYNPLKHHGEPMMTVTTFETAQTKAERRSNRTARRRSERRKQRVRLVQEIMAPAIAPIDPGFYRRIAESALWRDDKSVDQPYSLFCGDDYTDKDYHSAYPTIHHLIVDLMEDPRPHDPRLVYLACAWLVKHRGHFLSTVSEENVREIFNINVAYDALMETFGDTKPWQCDAESFGKLLKEKMRIKDKEKKMMELLYDGKKPVNPTPDPDDPDAPALYSVEHLIKLLCGGKAAPKDIFPYKKDAYEDLESVKLSMDDDQMAPILAALDADAELIIRLKALYDWAVLNDVLDGEKMISKAKVKAYHQHERDLRTLKDFIRKYMSRDKYKEVFCDAVTGNYASYTGHADRADRRPEKRVTKEDFCKYLKTLLKDLAVENDDREKYDDMMLRIETCSFLPKQREGDNRVIPYQLYLVELDAILKNACAYVPVLREKDADGITGAEKIRSVFTFRIPYFVGPLNKNSKAAWIERKAEKITPWNFTRVVDLDASEDGFIRRMTNRCTYLPSEDVLPQNSLYYEKFCVLNEINPLKINGIPITVEQKQTIYEELFLRCSRVTVKALKQFCLRNGYMQNGDEISGIDAEGIKSSLKTHHVFRSLREKGMLNTDQIERIVERMATTEDRQRLAGWIRREFPHLPEEDVKYIAKQKLREFGRLSRRFLCEMEGVDSKETGEMFTILDALWTTNNTLMQLLSDRFTFADTIRTETERYYRENRRSLSDRFDDMYVSPSVRRPIIRTLEMVQEYVKAIGCAPKKIFIEMARGATEEQKGKRTKTRREQIMEYYRKFAETEVRELSKLLETVDDNSLQSDKLFLYFLQLGKCMYSGEPIRLSDIGNNKLYDIDHIYPQSKVKDDSVLNNKVLVKTEQNRAKGDVYPIRADIRQNMCGYWKHLHDNGLVNDEKYRRLIRATPFSDNELSGFINRQLVETRQSTKVVATLLKERYPETEIVYVKAGLVSEFRQEFKMLKVRSVNDLHHAKDAYLNIVVGNVYHEKFNKKFFSLQDGYSLKTKELFKRPVFAGTAEIWRGESQIEQIRSIVGKNHIHVTRYAFCRKGALFDLQPLRADSSAELIPRKNGLPVERYGGYRKPTAAFFLPVRYRCGKKTDILITPIDLMAAERFDSDAQYRDVFTREAVEKIIGKPVDAVEYPLGMRKCKVNTVFSFDGFRMCLTGKSGGGRQLLMSPLMQLLLDPATELYVKRVESFMNKKEKNPNLVLNAAYDRITAEENNALFHVLLHKLETTVYAKRPTASAVAETLRKGTAQFERLSPEEQVQALCGIVSLFGRNGQGADLRLIGGGGKAGSPKLSSTVSNWKKYYSDVRIIDQSAAGLYEKQSVNLLELL